MAAKSKAADAAESVAVPAAVLDSVKALLAASEWSAPADAGGAKCPVCGAVRPLDPANPRAHEQHADDCALGQAIAALAAL